MNGTIVTVYTLTYNEEHIIEFFIKHYRKMFPNCIINVFDNYSTDNTVKIAKSLDCNVTQYDTNNTIDDRELLSIKSNSWKDATTDWVVSCDCDELLHITQDELLEEANLGVNLIKTVGYQMINKGDNINLSGMTNGWLDKTYSKVILFNKNEIKHIRYSFGCHTCIPISNDTSKRKFSTKKYVLTHYKFISKVFSLKKRKYINDRWSTWNRHRWNDVYETYMTDEYWDDWYNKPLTNIKKHLK